MPDFELGAALAFGEKLDYFLNLRKRDDANMLYLAVRGRKPALSADIGISSFIQDQLGAGNLWLAPGRGWLRRTEN
jgi:hypothetical protein